MFDRLSKIFAKVVVGTIIISIVLAFFAYVSLKTILGSAFVLFLFMWGADKAKSD